MTIYMSKKSRDVIFPGKKAPAGRYTTSHRVVKNITSVIWVINVIKVIKVLVIDMYVNSHTSTFTST